MTLSDFIQTNWEALKLPLDYLNSSDKRIYWVYILASVPIAFLVYYRTKRTFKGFFKYLFHKKVWWSKSAIIDYYFIFFNGYIKLFLIVPYLFFGKYLAYYFDEFLSVNVGLPSFKLGVTATIVWYTISLTFVRDFVTYITHLLMHKIPFLWEFHKIHHSATVLNPVTQYRIHPVELVINNITGTLALALVTGFFDYLSMHQISIYAFLGVNVFSLVFHMIGSNLRHSHVKLKYYNFLEYIFISPYQHQIHHSDNPKHFDKNIGSKFAIWDWLFGTLVRSNEAPRIRFGLGTRDNKNYNSFWKNLVRPFVFWNKKSETN